jgi:beta-glucosidase
VAMPWADHVAAIIEAWYPGIGGAQSLADILFGNVDPSGRLAVSFPRNDAQLPRPQIPGLVAETDPGGLPENVQRRKPVPFDVNYNIEGARVGYKWFESQHETPLFPFGYGLSYTTFALSDLNVNATQRTATFTVSNTGLRAGAEVAQVYAVLPASTGENSYKRLVGWGRVTLAAGESKSITVSMNQLTLSIFDVAKNAFVMAPGDYTIFAGSSSADIPLHVTLHVE